MKTIEKSRIGVCIPCSVGKHEECNEPVSIMGCACAAAHDVPPDVAVEEWAMKDFG